MGELISTLVQFTIIEYLIILNDCYYIRCTGSLHRYQMLYTGIDGILLLNCVPGGELLLPTRRRELVCPLLFPRCLEHAGNWLYKSFLCNILAIVVHDQLLLVLIIWKVIPKSLPRYVSDLFSLKEFRSIKLSWETVEICAE